MQLLNVLITCLQIASGAKEYLKQTLSLEHLKERVLIIECFTDCCI